MFASTGLRHRYAQNTVADFHVVDIGAPYSPFLRALADRVDASALSPQGRERARQALSDLHEATTDLRQADILQALCIPDAVRALLVLHRQRVLDLRDCREFDPAGRNLSALELLLDFAPMSVTDLHLARDRAPSPVGLNRSGAPVDPLMCIGLLTAGGISAQGGRGSRSSPLSLALVHPDRQAFVGALLAAGADPLQPYRNASDDSVGRARPLSCIGFAGQRGMNECESLMVSAILDPAQSDKRFRHVLKSAIEADSPRLFEALVMRFGAEKSTLLSRVLYQMGPQAGPRITACLMNFHSLLAITGAATGLRFGLTQPLILQIVARKMRHDDASCVPEIISALCYDAAVRSPLASTLQTLGHAVSPDVDTRNETLQARCRAFNWLLHQASDLACVNWVRAMLPAGPERVKMILSGLHVEAPAVVLRSLADRPLCPVPDRNEIAKRICNYVSVDAAAPQSAEWLAENIDNWLPVSRAIHLFSVLVNGMGLMNFAKLLSPILFLSFRARLVLDAANAINGPAVVAGGTRYYRRPAARQVFQIELYSSAAIYVSILSGVAIGQILKNRRREQFRARLLQHFAGA